MHRWTSNQSKLIDLNFKIFDPTLTIQELSFNDYKKLAIQEYKKEKLVASQLQIQVLVREWQPDEWKISEPYEILIAPSIMKIQDLLDILSRLFPFILVISIIIITYIARNLWNI